MFVAKRDSQKTISQDEWVLNIHYSHSKKNSRVIKMATITWIYATRLIFFMPNLLLKRFSMCRVVVCSCLMVGWLCCPPHQPTWSSAAVAIKVCWLWRAWASFKSQSVSWDCENFGIFVWKQQIVSFFMESFV